MSERVPAHQRSLLCRRRVSLSVESFPWFIPSAPHQSSYFRSTQLICTRQVVFSAFSRSRTLAINHSFTSGLKPTCLPHDTQRAPKSGATDSWQYFCQTLTDFKKDINGRFVGKFAVKWILKIPPRLAWVATLPCETLMSEKHAINDKLQGSIATYLIMVRFLINKLRKVYCWVCEWNFFLNRWMFGKVTSKSVVVSCTLCAWLKDKESAWDDHFLACNFGKYLPIFKNVTD